MKTHGKKVRICMMAYSFYESDNRVRRYAETLAQEGFEVDAIALRNEEQEPKGRLNGVNIYRIQRRSYTERNKHAYFFRIVLFCIRSTIFLSARQLVNGYKLLHIHSVPDFLVFTAILPKLFGSKLILDIHDLVPELFASKFKCERSAISFKALLLMEKLSASFSDHTIIANDIWHEVITNRSVNERKCTAIMNFPDSKLFKYCRPPKSQDKFVTIYPGTLSKHQGIETAIRAMHMLKGRIPNLEFRIYGKGTDKEFFEHLVSELDLNDTVIIRNLLPLEDVSKAMSEADLGIEPKLADGFANEAFSTKIFEFMMVGLPVVVSRTRVHDFYLNDSMVRFYEPGNTEQLSENIYSLWRNPKQLAKYSKNGLDFMRENSWDRKKSIYISIVNSLLEEESTPI